MSGKPITWAELQRRLEKGLSSLAGGEQTDLRGSASLYIDDSCIFSLSPPFSLTQVPVELADAPKNIASYTDMDGATAVLEKS